MRQNCIQTFSAVTTRSMPPASENIRKEENPFLSRNSGTCPKKFDLILSNPPYIPSEELPLLSEEVRKEPSEERQSGSAKPWRRKNSFFFISSPDCAEQSATSRKRTESGSDIFSVSCHSDRNSRRLLHYLDQRRPPDSDENPADADHGGNQL